MKRTSNTTEPVLSYINPAWGGPFLWTRNAKGNLVLVRAKKIIEGLQAAADRVTLLDVADPKAPTVTELNEGTDITDMLGGTR